MEQQYFIGEESIVNLENILEDYAPHSVFLVRGKKSYESSGAKNAIIKLLPSGIKLIEFYDFSENPKIEDLEKGIKLLNDHNCDLIIGIGGGSVLDMSKLIRFFHSYKGEMTKTEFTQFSALLPLIAIPTTAGTGSETTHFAVLYKDKVKYSVAHKDMLPDIAIVDPSFTYSNLPYLTACTGFDALAQAIEAYWNVNATEESDGYAIKAIKLLWPNLPIAVNMPTKEARDKVSEGSYWAGRAINITKTTAPHAFSYPFTSYYGYPHGHAVALTFPFFMSYNYTNDSQLLHSQINVNEYLVKLEKLYLLLDIPLTNITQTVCDYLTNIGLVSSIKDTNISEDLILSNINIQRSSNNPRIMQKEDYKFIIKKIIGIN